MSGALPRAASRGPRSRPALSPRAVPRDDPGDPDGWAPQFPEGWRACPRCGHGVTAPTWLCAICLAERAGLSTLSRQSLAPMRRLGELGGVAIPPAPPGTPSGGEKTAEAQSERLLEDLAASDRERERREAAQLRAKVTAAEALVAQQRAERLAAEREAARRAAARASHERAWAALLYDTSGAARRDANEAWWREHPEDAPVGWVGTAHGSAC